MNSVDEDTTYLEVNSPVDGASNDIWPGVYYEATDFSGVTVTGARLEIEAQSDPSAHLFWGISGNQFYYTNSPSGGETGDALAGSGWQVYSYNVIDEGVSTRTLAKLLADLADGALMAAMHIDDAFDVSSIRLLISYGGASWVRNIQRNDGFGDLSVAVAVVRDGQRAG